MTALIPIGGKNISLKLPNNTIARQVIPVANRPTLNEVCLVMVDHDWELEEA